MQNISPNSPQCLLLAPSMQLTSSLAHLTNGLVKRNNHSLATPRQPALKMCGIGQAAKYGPARLSVAPMMDWTDVHYRQLARLLSRHTWLWTEMVVDKTLMYTKQLDRFLWFPPEQRPLVCQLGGSDPATLAAATALAVQYGYDEINLNCGCPSDRVAGAGCFGAALMLQPHLVADCMAAMAAAAQGTPVSVKCRLGVDQVDSYAAVHEFVRVVSSTAPVTHFIIHARKCFLKGLNPHQNRTVPPLRYSWVYGLKRDFPHLRFRRQGLVLKDYCAYTDRVTQHFSAQEGGSKAAAVRMMMKPLLNLFHGEKGSKRWKAEVDTVLKGNPSSLAAVLDQTLQWLPDEVLDAPPRRGPCADSALHGLSSATPGPDQVLLGHVAAVSRGEARMSKKCMDLKLKI
ncbi:dihydrouridine synthase-domain-containing protein [Haematococcus lacustris]